MTLLPRSSLAALLVLLLTACGSDPAPDSASRTLAAPRDLQVGEWWDVIVDPELVGATIATRLVVTPRKGRYRIAATAPDGTVFEQAFDGSDGPAGRLVELFTYDLTEIELGGG